MLYHPITNITIIFEKKKKKNSISIILFTLTTPITRCPINHIDFLSSTICIKMNNGKKRS